MKKSSIAKVLLVALPLGFAGGCASPTHTVDAHPAQGDAQHGVESYQATDGSNTPATGGDAAVSAGAAAVDTAIGMTHGKPIVQDDTLIKGHCEIVGNGTAAPCATLGLVLKNLHGQILVRKRTTAAGDFSFSAKEDDTYFIGINSTKFDAPEFSPAPPFSAGSVVTIKLHASK